MFRRNASRPPTRSLCQGHRRSSRRPVAGCALLDGLAIRCRSRRRLRHSSIQSAVQVCLAHNLSHLRPAAGWAGTWGVKTFFFLGRLHVEVFSQAQSLLKQIGLHWSTCCDRIQFRAFLWGWMNSPRNLKMSAAQGIFVTGRSWPVRPMLCYMENNLYIAKLARCVYLVHVIALYWSSRVPIRVVAQLH